jgi:hypothetical protein
MVPSSPRSGVVLTAQATQVDGRAAMPRDSASTRACGLISVAAKMPADRGEQRVALQPLEVAGELLDAVDLADPLDLDRDRPPSPSRHSRSTGPRSVRNSRCTQLQSVLEVRRVGGQQLLQLLLDPVEGEPTLGVELVATSSRTSSSSIVSVSPLGLVTTHRSPVLDQGVGRVHPVQRLVGPDVGVDRDAAVGLDHHQRTADVRVDDRRPS